MFESEKAKQNWLNNLRYATLKLSKLMPNLVCCINYSNWLSNTQKMIVIKINTVCIIHMASRIVAKMIQTCTNHIHTCTVGGKKRNVHVAIPVSPFFKPSEEENKMAWVCAESEEDDDVVVGSSGYLPLYVQHYHLTNSSQSFSVRKQTKRV